MKKRLILLFALISLRSYAQLTPAEGFEGSFPPEGWLITNNGVGNNINTWQQANGNDTQPAFQGNHAAYLNSENVAPGSVAGDYLVTKPFTYPVNAQLRFYSRLFVPGNNGAVYKFYLLAEENTAINPSDFTTYPEPFLTWSENDFIPQTEYSERIISLPSGIPGNNYRIVFGMEGDNGDRWVIDQVSVLSECPVPVNLSVNDVEADTAWLNWTSTGNATSWEIEVVPADESPTGTGFTYNGLPPYQATGLASGTNYKFYVRALCQDGGSSNWTAPQTFSTSACATENQCNYTFILSDWWDGWNENNMYVTQNGVTIATLNLFNALSTEVTVALCNNQPFKVHSAFGPEFIMESGLIIINPFGQTIFEKNIGDEIAGDLIYSGEANCGSFACLPPENLVVTNATLSSVQLSWDGPAIGNWEYFFVEQGGAAPGDDAVGQPVTNNPATVTGLIAATSYDFYVKEVCSDTDNSDWAGPVTFSSAVCDPSLRCVYHFEMTSDNGGGYGGNNTMIISQGGVPVGVIGANFLLGTNAMADVPLCPGMPVEIYWNATDEGWNANSIGLTVYNSYFETYFTKPAGSGTINTIIFTGTPSCIAPVCPKPQQLLVSDLLSNSATLTWTEVGSATEWEYIVLPLGSPVPDNSATGTPASDTSAQLTNLQAGAIYVVYVRSVCSGADGFSEWSHAYTFSTLIVNDDCEDAISLDVNPGIECLAQTEAVMDRSTPSGIDPSCALEVVTGDVWYKFVATAQSHTVTVESPLFLYVLATVYEGNCGNLQEMFCSTERAILMEGLTIGDTYYIKVYTASTFQEATATFKICITTPMPITVAAVAGQAAISQLVNDILVTSDCAEVSNVTYLTGTNFGTVNGIGHFEKGASSFGIAEGIVLSTGDVMEIPGPNTSSLWGGVGTWPGDTQLLNYMNGLELNMGAESYFNATVLEFDFKPLSSHISFPFIFASEEYGTFQCSFSDTFAFFLTDITANTATTNLAVVPGTTNVPVSVVTIKDGAYNQQCGSLNEQYFDAFYSAVYPGGNPAAAPVNFEGTTVQLLAESDVVVGHTYHIKLVISDNNDPMYDSAVFIGAFDVGAVNLGPDLTVQNGSAPCSGEEQTIYASIEGEGYIFDWYKDGELIPNQQESSIVVTESGNYGVTAHTGTDVACNSSDSITVEFYDILSHTGNPVNLTACDVEGFHSFDFSGTTSLILQGINSAGIQISYHLNEEDAEDNVNPLPLTYQNATAYQQTIYVRLSNSILGCSGTKSFNLIVSQNSPQFTFEGIEICPGAIGTLNVIPANFDINLATFAWQRDGNILPYNTASIQVSIAGNYMVTVNYLGCETTASVEVTEIALPNSGAPGDVTTCTGFILPPLNNQSRYFTGAGGTGVELAAGTEITESQTLYVLTETSTGNCSADVSFTVSIVSIPDIIIIQGCDNLDYVLEVTFEHSEYNQDNVSFAWTDQDGQLVGSNDNVLNVSSTGTYYVTITSTTLPNCSTTKSVEVLDMECMIPRGVSPNNDGKNDDFDLSHLDVEKIKIFNRYGLEVYSKARYTNEWFGQTNDGTRLQTGTYYYMISMSGGKDVTGWVYVNWEP